MAVDCVYDVCVIGAGLWGSSAAYHASSHPDIRVCLVGPDEPKSKVGIIISFIRTPQYSIGISFNPIWLSLIEISDGYTQSCSFC